MMQGGEVFRPLRRIWIRTKEDRIKEGRLSL